MPAFAAPDVRRGRFVNPWPPAAGAPDDPAPAATQVSPESFRAFLRWRLDPGARAARRRLRASAWAPPRAEPALLARGAEGAAVTWVGHSTWLLQLDGLALLTDPVFGDLPFFPRRASPGLAPAALPPLDALLVSHNHYDHLERRFVEGLPRATPVRCGLGLAAWFRRLGFRDVEELGWGQSTDVQGVRATFVPARHFSGRTARDRDRTLWGGFVLEGRSARVYYAGDTGWFPEFGRIREAFPGLDLAILPVGAYEPRWFMRPVHVDPDEAVAAWLETGARTLACGHWGTYKLSDEPWEDPPRRALAAAARHGRGPDAWAPALGETRRFR